jgi:hypothetical protein
VDVDEEDDDDDVDVGVDVQADLGVDVQVDGRHDCIHYYTRGVHVHVHDSVANQLDVYDVVLTSFCFWTLGIGKQRLVQQLKLQFQFQRLSDDDDVTSSRKAGICEPHLRLLDNHPLDHYRNCLLHHRAHIHRPFDVVLAHDVQTYGNVAEHWMLMTMAL